MVRLCGAVRLSVRLYDSVWSVFGATYKTATAAAAYDLKRGEATTSTTTAAAR